jgi:hypothetical protein
MNMSGPRRDPSRKYSRGRFRGTLGAGAAATLGGGSGDPLEQAADPAPITRSDH